MAGAGYKLFNTGDVLTAAQVNTYLMEQTVMVFADATARTAALSGVVSEGMISYLKDTNAVEVYDGSNWVSSDDPNAIQNTIVDAKGDLISATAADTPARLAVGSNFAFLTADSAQSAGIKWDNAAWTAYTPTWTSDGTAPSLGNGSLTGFYKRVGSMCAFRISFTRGSTSTNGSGTYYFSLPFTSAFPGTNGCGTFYMEDFATAGYNGILTQSASTNIILRVPQNTAVGATSPFTWATNDFIHMSGVFEVSV